MAQGNLFPVGSEWIPPEKLPDLSDAKEIAIDRATRYFIMQAMM